MTIWKYFFYFTICVMLFFTACHLDKKKPAPDKPSDSSKSEQAEESAKAIIYSGLVQFTNARRYRDLLKANNRCDTCTNQKGPLECENFDNQAGVKIQFEKSELPSPATLTVQIHHQAPSGIFDNLDLWWGACNVRPVWPPQPLQMTGTAQYWNDYRGFHVRFEAGRLGYVFIRSENTLPFEDGLLDVTLYYGGRATSNMAFGTAELADPNSKDLHGNDSGRR